MILSAPIEVSLELTNACNLDCVYCYLNAGKRHPRELTTSEILHLLEDLADMKVFKVYLGGGEPLLHHDFFKIAKHGIDLGLDTVTSTNGTVFNRKILEKIKGVGITRCMQVSLDGATARTHDSLRGSKGAFKKAVYTIRLLAKNEVNVIVGTVISRYNIDELSRLIELSKNLGAKGIHFMSVMPSEKCHSSKIVEYDLPPEKWVSTLDFLTKKRKEMQGIFAINFPMRFSPFRQLPSLDKLTASDECFLGCRAGRTLCVITPTGDVLPCDVLRDKSFIAGNVRKTNFSSIWKNAEIFSVLRNIGVKDLKGKCVDCKYNYICLGGCKADSFYLAGDILSPDPRCPH